MWIQDSDGNTLSVGAVLEAVMSYEEFCETAGWSTREELMDLRDCLPTYWARYAAEWKAEMGYDIGQIFKEEPASEPVQAVESGCRGKSQIFQEEEVA